MPGPATSSPSTIPSTTSGSTPATDTWSSPPPVVVAAGDDVPAPGSDAPQPDAPSLEALVSALAQQASGMSPPMTPDPDADRARADGASGEPGRAQAPDRATAVARLVDR